jgi:exosortase family protein XrtM
MSQSGTTRHAWALARRGLVFLLVFLALQLGWQALSGTAVQKFIVHDCTVQTAAALVNLLTPNVHASAVNFTLQAVGGSLNIINGCEGMEALFILCAALVVAPMPWKLRALGFLFGTVVVFVINQARILVLFYAYRTDASLFDLLHGTITPIAVVVLVCSYFYAWLNYSQRSLPERG